MSRVLVIEETGDIQALLRKHFSRDHVVVDALPIGRAVTEKFTTWEYDVLIWDAVVSRTEQSRGLELLDLLTR
ncbi:MAG: hypothetical protein HYS66_13065, partial [Deltaproteobacteria bacterium]|nr:hypothetical protein [Deltaproteobacteria bacterium]